MIFVAAWAVAVFLVLRHFARGFFHERFRAEAAAAAVALTFLGTEAASAPHVDWGAGAPAPKTASLGLNMLGACRDPAARARGIGVGNVDGVLNATSPVPDGGRIDSWSYIHLGGWAADHKRAVPAWAVCPLVDGKFVTATFAFYGYARADVARARGIPSETATGFLLLLPRGIVEPGRHVVGAAVQSLDGTWQVLPHAMTLDFV